MAERVLEDFVTKKELEGILNETKPGCQMVGYDIQPAAQGLIGFLGDHLRVTIRVKQNNLVTKIHLFVKAVPLLNKPKAEFIMQNAFFKKEALTYNIFAEMMGIDGPDRWCPKSFVHNERVLVMPDLSTDGYKSVPVLEYFDRKHVLICTSAIARFHAAYAKYVTQKSTEDREYNIMDDYGHLMTESTFKRSPFLHSAAKLTSSFIQEFSEISDTYPSNLDETVYDLFVKACDSLRERDNTLNCLIHKDLWTNNIMFKYSGDVPVNAVLVDYQCQRYGPPAFDLMVFLYLTTSRSFRNLYEKDVLNYYYTVFCQDLDELTKGRLHKNNYDKDAFLDMCKEARLFGVVVPLVIFPFVLMDPLTAKNTFDDPDTFTELVESDRTAPVLALARKNIKYRRWQLEVCEEFVERYIKL